MRRSLVLDFINNNLVVSIIILVGVLVLLMFLVYLAIFFYRRFMIDSEVDRYIKEMAARGPTPSGFALSNSPTDGNANGSMAGNADPNADAMYRNLTNTRSLLNANTVQRVNYGDQVLFEGAGIGFDERFLQQFLQMQNQMMQSQAMQGQMMQNQMMQSQMLSPLAPGMQPFQNLQQFPMSQTQVGQSPFMNQTQLQSGFGTQQNQQNQQNQQTQQSGLGAQQSQQPGFGTLLPQPVVNGQQKFPAATQISQNPSASLKSPSPSSPPTSSTQYNGDRAKNQSQEGKPNSISHPTHSPRSQIEINSCFAAIFAYGFRQRYPIKGENCGGWWWRGVQRRPSQSRNYRSERVVGVRGESFKTFVGRGEGADLLTSNFYPLAMPHMSIAELKATVLTEVAVMFALINHPNIIKLLGYSEAPLSIVMKVYDRNLFSLVMSRPEYSTQRGPMDAIRKLRIDTKLTQGVLTKGFEMLPELALHLAWGIASGMQAMHSQGILHRDLKSANVLVEYRPISRHDEAFIVVDQATAKLAPKLHGSLDQSTFAGAVGWGKDINGRPCKSNDATWF